MFRRLKRDEGNVTPLDEQQRPLLARGVRLQIDPKNGEPMLLFPEGALYLSETAHEVVKLCAGKLTTQAIMESLAAEYETSVETLRQDVCDCLRELRVRKLLVFSSE
jgi:pyrroloquinoline quinone biosynthesis protein D